MISTDHTSNKKHLIMVSSLLPSYLFPLKPKYSTQHHNTPTPSAYVSPSICDSGERHNFRTYWNGTPCGFKSTHCS